MWSGLKSETLRFQSSVVVHTSSTEILAESIASSILGSQSSICDAVRKSIRCRSHDTGKQNYGKMLDKLVYTRSFTSVTIAASLIKMQDGIVALAVGSDILIRLDVSVVKSLLPDGFDLNDFVWVNRPITSNDKCVASKTRGTLEYTVKLKDDGKLYITGGLNLPSITENKAKPILGVGGALVKSDEKARLDDLKRGKNMYDHSLSLTHPF
jgi:hypothetical protein